MEKTIREAYEKPILTKEGQLTDITAAQVTFTI